MFRFISDQFRTLFRIRSARQSNFPGPRPPLGAKISRQDVRMTVQAGMSDDLWRWLTDRGWRQITVRHDRRSYRDVPASMVTHLIDAGPDERGAVLRMAIAAATMRSNGREAA